MAEYIHQAAKQWGKYSVTLRQGNSIEKTNKCSNVSVHTKQSDLSQQCTFSTLAEENDSESI